MSGAAGARRLIGAALAWALGGLVLVLLGAALLPLAFGMHTYSVQSGSMTPTIRTGDLVISQTIHPEQAQIGDIVMFKDPGGTGELISHRVRAIHLRGDRAYFITRGDANSGFEHWNVPESGTVGQVVYRLPKLGYVIGGVSSPAGKLLFVALPAVLLLVLGLIRIWTPERSDTDPAEESGS
jgi:signal peptidase I